MNKLTTVAKVLISGGVLFAAVAAAPDAHAAPRTHDGFYLQGDVGVGYLSSKSEKIASSQLTLSGVTTPFELLLGGTVGPVVIGGGLFADYSPSPTAKQEYAGTSTQEIPGFKMTFLGTVLFADIYPDVHGGMHFRPFLGYSDITLSYQGRSSTNDPHGLVFGLAGGYNWWVSDQWSIGVEGRFAYAPLKVTAGSQSVSYNTIAPAIMASFTYH